MQITDQLFNNLASLAKLEFEPAEQQQLMADLEKILNWVEQLQQVDVEGVEPQRHMSEANNLLRDDVAAAAMDNADALKPAAQNEAPYFNVPRFINR